MSFGFGELAEDKPRTITKALILVLVLVLGGWGFSTWWSLRAPPPEPTRPPREAIKPNDLGFLQPVALNEFSVRGSNPFYAPAPLTASPKPPRWIGAVKPIAPVAVKPLVEPKYKNQDLVYRGTHNGDDGQPLALVQDTSTNKSLFLKVGDSLQGGRVMEISTNNVLWEKAGQRVALKLGQPYTIGKVQVP